MATLTLTRPQFDRACQALARNHTPSYLKSWSWKEHSTYPGLGYLSRTLTLPCPADGLAEQDAVDEEPHGDLADSEEDAASIPPESVRLTTVQLYVVWSPSFQVPALYFSAHHDNGTPLNLAEICRLSLFRQHALSGEQVASFALQDRASSMALLSQGDHPTLGTPCWYIHPCNTSAVVGEIMAEVDDASWTDEERGVRWMEAWFMVEANMICLEE
ncbi:hypothetical protein BXZ70DRAFT_918552 [Cristinia sonorae]|uniref:Ubiquitin-like-conjugating enzyme ATG10 n=1 Tax=Cristinia sonorae TaxID=1940300 RepID=A0A8K0UXF8_9AGAR|nr:hypothetical protein BXZ70DRAFT_918552 [Cristinia sonorae]